LEIEPKKEMLHWRYLLHDTNTDRHTKVLNVLRQLALELGIKKKESGING
jgi:hypothetical protein